CCLAVPRLKTTWLTRQLPLSGLASCTDRRLLTRLRRRRRVRPLGLGTRKPTKTSRLQPPLCQRQRKGTGASSLSANLASYRIRNGAEYPLIWHRPDEQPKARAKLVAAVVLMLTLLSGIVWATVSFVPSQQPERRPDLNSIETVYRDLRQLTPTHRSTVP